MQLSDRLTTVAELVSKGSKVADIGCDHAHTSIYLVEHGIAVSSIAMDINRGPLQRAEENIRCFGYEDKITTRLSDGAKELKPGEADTLLISGMGGLLMNKILSESIEAVGEAKELILQPQSEISLVRKHIHELGFSIVKEAMLMEDKKYYTVIKAVRSRETGGQTAEVSETGNECEKYEKEIFYRYGKLLLEEKNPVLKQFLESGRIFYGNIVKEISGQEGERTKERCRELKEELVLMEEALAYYR